MRGWGAVIPAGIMPPMLDLAILWGWRFWGTMRRSACDGLVAVLREDMIVHGRAWALTKPGFQALAVHRIGAWVQQRAFPVRLLLLPIAVLYYFVRNVYGIELPFRARIGRRVRIVHGGIVMVHARATIGDDCAIRQNVTIGGIRPERWTEQAPTIGNGVELGVGAVIIGKITVGDNAKIGPNAVVTTNVPPGATVFAPPARIVRLAARPGS
jgi:serine O-acetyltransferase